MEEVTAGVCLVSIKRSRYSAVYGGGHAKTAFLHAAISAAAHQNFISFTNVQFGICYDERSELLNRLKYNSKLSARVSAVQWLYFGHHYPESGTF